MPYISVDGLFAWTAIGPFEWSLHALGAFVTSLLMTLKVDNLVQISWNQCFVPLYTALALQFYFSLTLFARLFVFYSARGRKLLWLLLNCLTSGSILGALTWLEVSLAHYLDSSSEQDLVQVEASGGLLLAILSVSLVRLLVIKMPEDRDYYGDEFDCM